MSIKALCTVNLEINANITINEKEAIFLPGKEVNAKMKQLAGDDTSTTIPPFFFKDENILSIKYSKTEPIESEKQEKNIVSAIDSPYPIYMWYKEGTIYWWSEDKCPNMDSDSSYMFISMTSLNDISGISKYDASNVTTMMGTFASTYNLTSVNDISFWNTSNVTNMQSIFAVSGIRDLNGLANWDVSNVTNFALAFQNVTSLTSVIALKNWDTSNAINMKQMFNKTRLESLKGLEDWNTSNVTNMDLLFAEIPTLSSVEPLKSWDTSKVTSMWQMFSKTPLVTLNGLENWDTSNVTKMKQLFLQMFSSPLTDISAIVNWNVSNVTDFTQMFDYCKNITDASALNNWDVQATATFTSMFKEVPTHPEFSKVPGTWSNGTFTPTS